jgi:Glycolipid 2-alpha-mannosyltransferase
VSYDPGTTDISDPTKPQVYGGNTGIASDEKVQREVHDLREGLTILRSLFAILCYCNYLLFFIAACSYQYPVIVFVEEDLANDEGRRTIRSFTGPDTDSQSRLFIQVVRFQIPDFVTGPVPKRAGNGKPIGYRHMCRFHARTVYEQPTIGFTYADGRPVIEYAWRLDDDSFLFRPINYDVFAFMRDRQLLYGYIQVRS